jgi:hypothetical protein
MYEVKYNKEAEMCNHEYFFDDVDDNMSAQRVKCTEHIAHM